MSPLLLRGKTVGILGFGSIGQAVARIAKAGFGMKVVALTNAPRTQPHEYADELCSFSESGVKAVAQVVKDSDYIVVALPKTRCTNKLLCADMLELIKPSCVLVNVGRGNSIDEEALTSLLLTPPARGERGLCAALDVFEKEPLPPHSRLWSVPSDRSRRIVNDTLVW